MLSVTDSWPWLALVGLGFYHGLNPAMDWLFAVALGFLRNDRSAVVRSLLPIAIGHEASIALVVVLVSGLQLLWAPDVLRPIGALALIGFGIKKLVKPGHPKWVGMQVTIKDLVLWSFLMSTAHGAGLMLFPVLLGLPAPTHVEDIGLQDLAAVLLHTLTMLVTMGATALLVFDRVGVMVLRKAWVNVDAIWAVAVITAGLVTLFT